MFQRITGDYYGAWRFTKNDSIDGSCMSEPEELRVSCQSNTQYDIDHFNQYGYMSRDMPPFEYISMTENESDIE